jgi:hypothetical protein
MKLGRNEICHCGSGKKYKQCHQLKISSQSNQSFFLGIILLVLIAIVFLSNSKFTSTSNQADLSPRPFSLENKSTSTQPKGEPLSGKVWSVEHGHWHDDPSFQSNNSSENNFVDKSNDNARMEKNKNLDKKWNNEHGHYHDK